MSTTNITKALKVLNPLVAALEEAYWDASEIQLKDRIFDLVTCIHAELNELAKLSISDLDLPYEPITPEFGSCCQKLKWVYSEIENCFPRTKTAKKLKSALPEASSLLAACEL